MEKPVRTRSALAFVAFVALAADAEAQSQIPVTATVLPVQVEAPSARAVQAELGRPRAEPRLAGVGVLRFTQVAPTPTAVPAKAIAYTVVAGRLRRVTVDWTPASLPPLGAARSEPLPLEPRSRLMRLTVTTVLASDS